MMNGTIHPVSDPASMSFGREQGWDGAFFQVTTSYQNTNIASEGVLYGDAFEHIVNVTSHHWMCINT